ncbi:MAG: hypothetical protein ACFE8N_03375 [Promethearchaeota archaeon]
MRDDEPIEVNLFSIKLNPTAASIFYVVLPIVLDLIPMLVYSIQTALSIGISELLFIYNLSFTIFYIFLPI